MKKIFLLLICILLGLSFFSVDGDAYYDVKSEPINYDDFFEKKEINYSFFSSKEISNDEKLNIKHNDIEYDFLVGNNTFYEVSNYSFSCNYYLTIIDEKVSDNCTFLGLIIIPKRANHFYRFEGVPRNSTILEVLTIIDSDLYIDFYQLQDNAFESICDSSIVIDDVSDNSDLSNSLLDFLNYERHYLLSQLNLETIRISDRELEDMREDQNRNGYCNNAQTVYYQQYDNYTSNSGALNIFLNDSTARNYYKKYKNTFSDYSQASDTMIKYLIPKSLFTTTGIFSYIGTSYGFFIKTVYSNTGYDSEFIIISIEQKKKSYAQNGYLTIKPIFKGFADCPNDTGFISQVYDGSKLVLANINVNISLSNEDELNIGDTGYNASLDYGYYIDSYSILYNGRKSKLDTFDAKYLRYMASALGYIPKIGNYLKWTTDAFISLGEWYYNNNCIQINPELMNYSGDNYYIQKNYINPYVNTNQMITAYGNLIKGIDSSIVKNNSEVSTNNPLLFDVNDANRVYIEYSFKTSDLQTEPFDALIETRISLDIYEDNTKQILGIPSGNVVFQDSVNNSWAEEYNELRSSATHTIDVDTPTEVEYIENGYQDYIFTPIATANYEIETFGTDYDTRIEVYSGNTLVASDNDSGLYINSNNESICSKVNISLVQNCTYKIRVKGDDNGNNNYLGGYTKLIVKRWKSDLVEQTTNSGLSGINGYSVWQKFIPTRSDIYDIFTIDYNDITSSYLELYDSNHNLIAYSGSYHNSNNGKVSLYLEQGVTYLVKSRHKGNVTETHGFGVVVAKVEEIAESHPNMYYYTANQIIKGYNDAIVYCFEPVFTSNYDFYTTFSSGKKDVVMYLFDENFNQLAYDDDSNGNMQPKITYNCQYFRTYYIMVKHYSASSGEWTWFNFNVEEA